MPIVATREMKEVKGSIQKFEKLSINAEFLIDVFETEISINPQYLSEYKTILSYMNLYADRVHLPISKFRELKGGKGGIKEYEFKSKQLRVYVCSIPGGKLVVMGGYKKTQKDDINRLRILIKGYIAFAKL